MSHPIEIISKHFTEFSALAEAKELNKKRSAMRSIGAQSFYYEVSKAKKFALRRWIVSRR